MLIFSPGHCSFLFSYLFLLESLLIIIVTVLFSYGYPDETRMTLWKEGGIRRYNSNPALRIYIYANHKEPPPIPYIWSRNSSDFNLAIGILSAWVFIARMLLQYFDILGKWTELFLHCCVLPFWVLSVVGQQSADFTDPDHISRSPWYLSVGCSSASSDAQIACRVAQASLGMTIITAFFYSGLIWRILGFEIFESWLKKSLAKRKASPSLRLSKFKMGENTFSSNDDSDDEDSARDWRYC